MPLLIIRAFSLQWVVGLECLPREALPCRLAQLGHDVYYFGNRHADLLPGVALPQRDCVFLFPLTSGCIVHSHRKRHAQLICSRIALAYGHTCMAAARIDVLPTSGTRAVCEASSKIPMI